MRLITDERADEDPEDHKRSLEDYQTVTDKQRTPYQHNTQGKMEDAPRLLRIPKSECPEF